MSTHELKCWPQEFDLSAAGLKPFEIRKNDRDYSVGDTVTLRRWNPSTGEYTGQCLDARIGVVIGGPVWGLPIGVCVFSLLDVAVRAKKGAR